jgi:hypothetical protein
MGTLDEEQKKRVQAMRDSRNAPAIQHLIAPLVLADTLKSALLSKDKKVVDEFKKSTKDYPESVFNNSLESIDAIMSHAPKWAAENPSTAAGLGLALDIADPLSYGALKGLKGVKYAPMLAKGTQKLGEDLAEKGVKQYVQKLVKKKDIGDVPTIAKWITENKLRGSLRDPEKLIEQVAGKKKLDSSSLEGGTLNEVGKQLSQTTKAADLMGAPKVNRGDIQRKMVKEIRSLNTNKNSGDTVSVGAYSDELKKRIKPYDIERYVVPGNKVEKPELIPQLNEVSSDLQSRIDDLAKEIGQVKKAKLAQKTQKAELSQLEKQSVGPTTGEVNPPLSVQKTERAAAEKMTLAENKRILSDNEVVAKRLQALEAKKALANEKIKPMELIPEPKGDNFPVEEILNIRAHNKRAAIVNKKYMESLDAKYDLPAVEEEIQSLQGKLKQTQEVGVPPVIPEEAIPVNPPSVPKSLEVPPAVPDEAIGSLEERIAKMADLKNQKSKVSKADTKIYEDNKKAIAQFREEAKENAPRIEAREVDTISDLNDMWQLKVNLGKKLNDLDFDKTLTDLPAKKEQIRRAMIEIDDRIKESLKGIELPQGNAADVYSSLNKEYGTQKDFLDLVVNDTINTWRSGAGRGGMLPSISGAVSAAIAAKTMGANVPLATVAGGATGEAVRRSFFGNVPEIKAAIGDRLSQPLPAHLATQAGMEAVEFPLEVPKEDMTREMESQAPAEGDNNISIGEEDMSPEMQQLYRQSQGRQPQSEPMQEQPSQDPIEQKMDETLAPQKPMWNPYINEQILNTPLPRNTERLLANPTAIIAKLGQVAPDQVPMLKDMMEHDQDGLREAAPKLAMMFPAVFEKDKYGMFDGKIVDPMMQQKFLMDLSQDEGMSSIEKADIAMKINRQESIH